MTTSAIANLLELAHTKLAAAVALLQTRYNIDTEVETALNDVVVSLPAITAAVRGLGHTGDPMGR